ncbi:hypothetical protein ABTE60_21790, partial [Acinetobacter baumannii]
IAMATPAAAQVRALDNGVEVTRGGMAVRVTALSASVLRVRMARDGQWPEDASWAVPAEVRTRSTKVRARGDGFDTDALTV